MKKSLIAFALLAAAAGAHAASQPIKAAAPAPVAAGAPGVGTPGCIALRARYTPAATMATTTTPAAIQLPVDDCLRTFTLGLSNAYPLWIRSSAICSLRASPLRERTRFLAAPPRSVAPFRP